jgi:DNA-binding response OmpR family regulator
LNLRCSDLRQQGWDVLGSVSGYDGVIQFSQERVDAVVFDCNDEGTEAALIIGELKRLRPEVPVILLVSDESPLAPDATKQADAVVTKLQDGRSLSDALSKLLPAR